MPRLTNNWNKDSPAWVVPMLAAGTFLFQGIPPIIASKTILSAHTIELVSLVCDLANIFLAAFAIFIGKGSNNKEE